MQRFALAFLIFTFGFFSAGFGQSELSKDVPFINYLIDNHEYSDAISVLHKIPEGKLQDTGSRDSLNYLLAWSYYNKKSLDTSAFYFSKVSAMSPFYSKSVFYQSFDYLYTKRHEEAKKVLSEFSTKDSSLEKFKNYQQAGISLLTRDYKTFEEKKSKFTYDYFPLSAEEKNLNEYYMDLKKVKKRSPVVAGVLSAIVPGAGKVYAGFRMQGFASFLQCVAFGAATAESYYKWHHPSSGQLQRSIKNEPRSARLIVMGSLFSVFYIGNIWGSALSVQIKREEHFNEIDNAILVDMHIPLRRIFN